MIESYFLIALEAEAIDALSFVYPLIQAYALYREMIESQGGYCKKTPLLKFNHYKKERF